MRVLANAVVVLTLSVVVAGVIVVFSVLIIEEE